jgi:hypothetical protein
MAEATEAKLICGVVMPISEIDGCNEGHWTDVLDIFTEAIEQAGFEANLVSNADDAGIIHKRIIQNLYDNPVVVCDVSGKNPNVMFELGMRLAFDKPTVIVKDERTSYSFDTSAIEHLEYPRDLRFSRIVEFKKKLTEKIIATHRRATSDATYTTFLKHFGEFTVAKIDKKEVPGQEFILEELRGMKTALRRLELSPVARESEFLGRHRPKSDIDMCMAGWTNSRMERLVSAASRNPLIQKSRMYEREPGHFHLSADIVPEANIEDVRSALDLASRPLLKRLPLVEPKAKAVD